MNLSPKIHRTIFVAVLLLILQFSASASGTDTLRLFLIGNSFSQNAARYLPQLAKEGNHPLVLGRAEIGGCPLKKHWELAELSETNPDDPKGKPYNGKSLRMLLSQGKWDVVTLQQYSMHSGDISTYRPYAEKLFNYIKSIQPDATVVIHQTWAYRDDSKDWTQISEGNFARNSEEMYNMSKSAYYTIASELGVKVMPVGDAFRQVSTDKKWKFTPDASFDYKNPVYPNLPVEKNSLHVGYFWNKEQKFAFDSHHANAAGCFLGSLVWYSFLFNDSPEKLKFVPQEVPADFAVYLKKVARLVAK
jgi:hypothetical protein